jgi:hypothetical protein
MKESRTARSKPMQNKGKHPQKLADGTIRNTRVVNKHRASGGPQHEDYIGSPKPDMHPLQYYV